MPKGINFSSKTMLGVSIFFFSDLYSKWPDYKNASIFIYGQNKKFKFVLQCH